MQYSHSKCCPMCLCSGVLFFTLALSSNSFSSKTLIFGAAFNFQFCSIKHLAMSSILQVQSSWLYFSFHIDGKYSNIQHVTLQILYIVGLNLFPNFLQEIGYCRTAPVYMI